MRNIMKHHSGTPSGTGFFMPKFTQNWYFSCGGKNIRFLENMFDQMTSARIVIFMRQN